jgi:hypothetical protein
VGGNGLLKIVKPQGTEFVVYLRNRPKRGTASSFAIIYRDVGITELMLIDTSEDSNGVIFRISVTSNSLDVVQMSVVSHKPRIVDLIQIADRILG